MTSDEKLERLVAMAQDAAAGDTDALFDELGSLRAAMEAMAVRAEGAGDHVGHLGCYAIETLAVLFAAYVKASHE
jgi:hypothetical protein